MNRTHPGTDKNGWESSARPWIELMAVGDPSRVGVLDPAMLKLCGDVSGQDVVDIGCGEGRFCRMLAARGARTMGIDPTAGLIDEARRHHPTGLYHQGVAESLPLPSASVDLAVSYVALVDIPDYRRAIEEMARVVRPGGRCVVANLNGFSTASTDYWARDEQGRKLHWTFDHYMTERSYRAEWAGVSIVNWHRPLSAYLQAFLATGLLLEHFDEALPTREAVLAHPRLADHLRMPHFCTMVWRKI